QRRSGNVRSSHDAISDLLWIECFAVDCEQVIKLAWPPTIHDNPDGGFAHAEEIREWTEVRCCGDDLSHVEVPIGPAIKLMTDTESRRIVHCRMAHRAGDAD